MLAISGDSPFCHAAFVKARNFPFPLLSDESKTIAGDYGVWVEKSMYGRKYMGIDRTTFVISQEGRISAVLTGLKPDEHAAAAMAALKAK